jgi:hypothetical protein
MATVLGQFRQSLSAPANRNRPNLASTRCLFLATQCSRLLCTSAGFSQRSKDE